MPLKKTASKRVNSLERNRRNRARTKAVSFFGSSAVNNKEVHHKNGNNNDNRKSNLSLCTKKGHGKKHGRGNGKRGKR